VAADLLGPIRSVVARLEHRFTIHASDQMAERGILSDEVEQAILAEDAEIIEDYPEDARGPSCLILGRTSQGRVLHVHLSYPTTVKVITVCEPDPERWTDYRHRR